MSLVNVQGSDLYFEEKGDGTPILLIHPAGATASTWGAAIDNLAQVGRVIAYDRRGYRRSGGDPVRSIRTHTEDAAALLDALRTEPSVVVGTSIGATIAIDLALRRPDLVRAVVAHESPWRVTRQPPTVSQLAALARMGWLASRGRHSEAAAAFLRFAYTYRDGGTAWDAFPEEWRHFAHENATAALADIRTAIDSYPPPKDSLASNRRSYAPTANGVPTPWPGSPARSPGRSRPPKSARSKARVAPHCSTLPPTSYRWSYERFVRPEMHEIRAEGSERPSEIRPGLLAAATGERTACSTSLMAMRSFRQPEMTGGPSDLGPGQFGGHGVSGRV